MKRMIQNKPPVAIAALALWLLLPGARSNSAAAFAPGKRAPLAAQQAATEPPNESLEARRVPALWRRIATSAAPQKEPTPKANTADKPAATGTIIITLDIDEPDLEILIDGQKPKAVQSVDKNQVALTDVPCGRHVVSFSHPTIDAFEQEVEVSSNAPLYINPPLERAYVLLIIESEPGAELFIDDARICWGEGDEGKPGESKKGKSVCELDSHGRTPPLPVIPGVHTIRLRKAGFVGVERQVTATNKTNEIPIKLKRDKHGKGRTR